MAPVGWVFYVLYHKSNRYVHAKSDAAGTPPRRFSCIAESILHLGELLEEGVIVLEGGFAPDGVRDVVRGKSAAQLSQFARLPDHPTLIDPNRL